jgi:hypothetical protein
VPAYLCHEFSSLDALREAVAGLAPEAADSDFFYSLAWFANLAEHGLPQGNEARYVLVRDCSQRAAMCLPLQTTGDGVSSLSNFYSSLFGPIVWGPLTLGDAALWNALATHLRQHQPPYAQMTFQPLDVESACYLGLQTSLRRTGFAVDPYFCFGNWYLRVDSRSFATYAQTLPSALRNSIARGQRRLTRHGDWAIHIQCAEDYLLENSIAEFVQVYQRSWKHAEPHPEFIPGLARTAAAQGWLRLGVLTLQGQAIAAQLWLVRNGKASIYKLAYVEGFERFSAGSVLTHALMEHVLDADHVQEVDYLTGDDAYKRDWMSHRRERRGIVAFDLRTCKGLWAAARHFGGRWLKRGNNLA